MPSDKYKEYTVANREGWTRIVYGGSTRYRSPGNLEISNRQYYKLSEKYPTPNPIPESVVATAAGINTATETLKPTPASKPAFMHGSTAPAQEYFPKPPPMPEHPDPGAQRLGQQQAQAQQENRDPESHRDNIIEMVPGVSDTPKSKRYDHRSKHPKPSAQTLSVGIRKLLLLITTLIVAKILNDERAAMKDQEATILASALANLLEPTKLNENFGWVIADTGDYQAIIYVMIMYGSRVNDIVQDKKRSAAGGQQHTSTMPPPSAPSSNGYQSTPLNNAPRTPGANLPFSPLKAPPGINNYGG